MIKYSPDMTEAEKAELLREIEELDRAYETAQVFDEAHADPDAEPEEDQMELLRRAGLNRGQP